MQLIAKGLLLGLAYVAPIGMQNSYIIQSASLLSKKRAYQIAWITTGFDLSLALACYWGVGALMEAIPWTKMLLLSAGSLAVIWIGIGMLRSGITRFENANFERTLGQIAWGCFAVTWLNPQALIDGTMFVGGFRASMPPDQAVLMFSGVCMASLFWFSGLTTLIIWGRKYFTNRVQQGINRFCGIVVIFYGLLLGVRFFQGVL